MNPQHDNSCDDYKAFMNTLIKEVICPYCGSPNQLDPPILCCGEIHAEEVYSDGNETFTKDGLEYEFSRWLAAKNSDEKYESFKDANPVD